MNCCQTSGSASWMTFCTSRLQSQTMKMMEKFMTGMCILYLMSLTQCSSSSGNIVTFNLMEDAFDDQYVTCKKQMDKIMPALLKKEMKNNTLLAAAWKEVEDFWRKNKNATRNYPPGFKDVHGIALDVYTLDNITINGVPQNVYSILNKEMRSAGKSRDHYMKNFHYKALHYYLTRAVQLLWTGCEEKIVVYRGASIPKYNVTSPLRFGQFTSSSLLPDVAEEFGTDPFFEIATCYGVLIAGFSFFPGEAEFLIPGQEMFELVGRNETTFWLESTGELCSNFECAYIRKTQKKKVCRKLPNPINPESQPDGKFPATGVKGQRTY